MGDNMLVELENGPGSSMMTELISCVDRVPEASPGSDMMP